MGYYEYDYGFDYGFEPGIEEMVGSVFGVVFGFLLVFYLLLIAFAVTVYVLQSLGFYTIAKRRQIRNPWLAWLPIGNMWILGSISDQYQYVAKGRIRNRRKILMGLTAAMLLASMLMNVGAMITLFTEAAAMDPTETLLGMTIASMLLVYFILIVITIIAIVFQYIALYDLFASCDPGNSVLYLVLSIFLGVTLPFFIFACRKKDYGMPPRRAPEPAPIQYFTAEPVVEPPVEPVVREQTEEL